MLPLKISHRQPSSYHADELASGKQLTLSNPTRKSANPIRNISCDTIEDIIGITGCRRIRRPAPPPFKVA
jgi:hypothetical protein